MFNLTGFSINAEIAKVKYFISKKFIPIVVDRNSNFIVWGFGNLDKYQDTFHHNSLTDLFDRNLKIEIKAKEIKIYNDWLGSIPIFYNSKNYVISTNINLCKQDDEFDTNGLNDYLRFGYCFNTKTPYKNIYFLEPFSELIYTRKAIEIKKKEIDFESHLIPNSDPVEIIKDIKNDIDSKVMDKKIILPLSGGYDSRMLAYLCRNKEISAFTYGISHDRRKSKETVFAKKISEILNISWEEIPLNEFYKYSDIWLKYFGPSTHLHGMYHIEFYQKVLERLGVDSIENSIILSGIVGDIWARSHEIKFKKENFDPQIFSFSHGVAIKKGSKLLGKNLEIKYENFYLENEDLINNPSLHPILIVRTKIMLLSYLLSIPESIGYKTVTPFLNFKIVLNILSLNSTQKNERSWQSNFFKQKSIYVEDLNLDFTNQNVLDLMAIDFKYVKLKNYNKLKKIKLSYLHFCLLNFSIFIFSILKKVRLLKFMIYSSRFNKLFLSKILIPYFLVKPFDSYDR